MGKKVARELILSATTGATLEKSVAADGSGAVEFTTEEEADSNQWTAGS